MTINWYNISMTANNEPIPYVATASSEFSATYAAWKAFNGTNVDVLDRWRSSTKANQYIQINFGKALVIDTIKITSPSSPVTEVPTRIEVQGSNDGVTFTSITTISTLTTYTSSESRVFEIPLSNYKYMRLIPLSTISTSSYFSIGEITFGLGGNTHLIKYNNEYNTFTKPIKKSLVPIMTSDTNVDGTSSASSVRNDDEAWKAFDDSDSTSWVATDIRNTWIQFEFSTPRVVSEYSLMNSVAINQLPSVFMLQASNDGVNYIDLDFQNSLTPVLREEYTFKVNNPNSYKYYRLYVLRNNGHTSITSITQLKLYGFDTMNEYLGQLGDFVKVTDTMPTEQQFTQSGISDLSTLDSTDYIINQELLVDGRLSGGEGNLYTTTINLDVLFNIKSIEVV